MAGLVVRPFYLILVHPTLRILVLLLLAVAIQFVPVRTLVIAGLLLVGGASWCCREVFLKMLHRSKWLLLTLMLIFSFSTPGEFVHGWPSALAPTYEGFDAGVVQLIRLVIMLAGLSILLECTGRDALVAGFYALLRPLGGLGLPVDRLTVRLWLTLNYVERNPDHLASRQSVLDGLNDIAPDVACHSIRFSIPALTRYDGMAIVVIFSILIWWAL